jgi:hypothetical protein
MEEGGVAANEAVFKMMNGMKKYCANLLSL